LYANVKGAKVGEAIDVWDRMARMLTEIKNSSSRYRVRFLRYHAGFVMVEFGGTELSGGVLGAWKSRKDEI
jgi:hypothetical protein